jgi:hypothetical protein
MKKIILSALLLTSLNLHSQISIEGGVKGSYNTTWLFNKNISDQGTHLGFKQEPIEFIAYSNGYMLMVTLTFTFALHIKI